MGEQQPPVVRRAAWWAVGCAVLFTAFAFGTTQIRALRAHSHWQDDPYDVVVSFTQLLVPALGLALAVRLAAGRPAPRDLLRGGRAVLALVAATAVADWIAVALRTHADLWGGTGRLLVAALAALTLAAGATALVLHRATAGDRTGSSVQQGNQGIAPDRDADPDGSGTVPGRAVATVPAGSRGRGAAVAERAGSLPQHGNPAPDWAEDVLDGVGRVTARCGTPGRAVARALAWVRRVVVGGRHGLRRHRLTTAVLGSLAVAAGMTVAEARGDGLGAQPVAAAVARTAIGAACLLAAVVPINAYLGVLRRRDDRPVPARWSALACAGYAMVASVPVALAFRAGVGALLDYPVTSWERLGRLVAVVAVLAGLLTVLVLGVRRRRRWPAKALLSVPLAIVLAVVGTVGYLGVRHVLPRSLPAPTGPYRVGRVAFDWTDTGRVDPLAPHPGRHRELSVWVWYPAAAGGRPAPYAPGHWAGMLSFGLLANRLDVLRTHSVAGAPVAAGRFPLVVLEPGLGLAAPQFSALAEDLASHGIVVAGVTPTYSANRTVLNGHPVAPTAAGNPADPERLNDGRLLAVWAADARFAADRIRRVGGRLAGHVDARRVAYVGHSFGGAAALQACHEDRRCVGAADLDGTPYGPVVRTGLAAPMLLLGTPGDCIAGACHPTDAVHREIAAASGSLRAASTGPAFRYEIAGAEHFNFTDYGAYYVPSALHGLAQLGPIDGDRGLVVADAYVTAFARHVLRGGPPPALDPHRFPEVHPAR